MNYEYIKDKTLEVYKRSGTISFPIDCFHTLHSLKIPYKPYSGQSAKKQAHCYMVSDDAFTLKGMIFYNDTSLIGRMRFSLMHELGHIILEHKEVPTQEMEKEANFFASQILAPRMVIHYARCKNETEVAKVFDITVECARYAFNDYKRWHRYILYHRTSPFDKALYEHFYDKTQKRFIYHRGFCSLCTNTIYNSKTGLCNSCSGMLRRHTLESSRLNALKFSDELM